MRCLSANSDRTAPIERYFPGTPVTSIQCMRKAVPGFPCLFPLTGLIKEFSLHPTLIRTSRNDDCGLQTAEEKEVPKRGTKNSVETTPFRAPNWIYIAVDSAFTSLIENWLRYSIPRARENGYQIIKPVRTSKISPAEESYSSLLLLLLMRVIFCALFCTGVEISAER